MENIELNDMENKENIENMKQIYPTRIPLPLKSSKAIPKNVIERNNLAAIVNRYPFKTINNQSHSPSEAGCSNTKKSTHIINAKHVTIRNKNEKQDFADMPFNNKTIESEENEKNLDIVQNKLQLNAVEKSKREGTPIINSSNLEPKGVRLIKKSLKRPHSRELQGLSPLAEGDRKEDIVKRRLHFGEKFRENQQPPSFLEKVYVKCLGREYTNELFVHLLMSERRPKELPMISSVTRTCIINWLMKVNGQNGNPAVIQSACWYFDSILGVVIVQVSKLQLIAAACYWVALKLHGTPVPASRLVKCSNQAFTAKELVVAERVVLKKLKFPTLPVVPQDYITYFAWWCDNESPVEIETASTFLCMSGLMVDKFFCNEYPSAIAAASVKNALLLTGKGSTMAVLQECPQFQEAEKKASNMKFLSSIQRKAIRAVSAPLYEYKTPMEHYGIYPHYFAQRIVAASFAMTMLD